MASGKPSLKPFLSPGARSELYAIWLYNAERHGASHADAYEAFLLRGIAHLSGEYAEGRAARGFSDLFRTTLRQGRGDGHVVIYEIDEASEIVRVLHAYHERQDIGSRLSRER